MRLKKLGVILIAVGALGAIAVGSASATPTTEAKQWFTGASPGTILGGTEKLFLSTKSGTTSTLTSKIGKSLTPVKISSTSSSCTLCEILNRPVTGKGGGVAFGTGLINFSGLTVNEPAHCRVAAGGFVTTEVLNVHADLMNGTRAVQQFIPEAGPTEPFVTFELENNGGTCAVAGLYAVTGTLYATAVNNTGVFAASQEVEISQAIETANGGGLFIGSQPAVLTGTGVFSIGGTQFAIH